MDRVRRGHYWHYCSGRSVAALAVAILLSSAVAHADGTGQVVIHVTDAQTGKAVVLAVAHLQGRSNLEGFSDAQGVIDFGDVLSGTYTLTISKDQYASTTPTQIDVSEGQTVDVAVPLVPIGLNIIAQVTTSRRGSASTSALSVDSPYTSAFDTLLDAIGTLPGANYVSGPPSSFGLDGRGSGEASLNLDGIPLGPAGAGLLNGLDTDVFSGASLDHGFDAGNSVGALNFSAPDPTIDWISTVLGGVGSRGRNVGGVTERGSLGRLGISAALASRQDFGANNGATYLDSSGAFYSHNFGSATETSEVRLRYPTSLYNTLTLTNVQDSGSYHPVCNVMFGPTPCGYGPGNIVTSDGVSTRLQDIGSIGAVTLSGTIFSNVDSISQDQSGRSVAGYAFPFEDFAHYRQTGYRLVTDWSAPTGNDGLTASVLSYTTTEQERQSVLQPYSLGSNSYFEFQLDANQHSSRRFAPTFDEFIGSQQFENTTASIYAGADMIKPLNGSSKLTLQGILGKSAFGQPASAGISSPDSLLYDCNDGYAFGVASNFGGPKPSSSLLSANWSAALGAQRLNATAYIEQDQSIPLSTTIAGSSLVPSVFPPGYFDEANQLASSQDLCGRPTSFSPANTIFTIPVTGNILLRGLRFADIVQLNKRTAFYLNAGLQSARVLTEDVTAATPYSMLRFGAQLPNVPLYTGAAQIYDELSPNAAFVGGVVGAAGNNPNNLPGYVAANAAISYQLQRGVIQLSAQNIFGKYSDPSPAFSLGQRQETLGGVALPTMPIPLAAPSFSLYYFVAFGPPNASREINATQTTVSGPSADVNILPLPDIVPPFSYSVDRIASTCAPELVSLAGTDLQKLKVYVAQIQAAYHRSGSYPKEYPELVLAPSLRLSYVAAEPSFVLVLSDLTRVTPADVPVARALLGCSRTYYAKADLYSGRGIYIDPTAKAGDYQVLFSPSVGFYYVAYTEGTRQAIRLLEPLPSASPVAPFTLRGPTQCASEVRPAALALLTNLHQFVEQLDSGVASPPSPKGWTVTLHRSPLGYWLSLNPDSTDLLRAVFNCGFITYLDDATAKSILGEAGESELLGFSPKVGLFVRNKTLFLSL